MPSKKLPILPAADEPLTTLVGRPIRTAFIPLNLDGYAADIGATLRTNPPMREYEGLSSDTRGALRKLILSWNLVDDGGTALELDDNLSGATDEELAALLNGWYAQVKLRTTPGKS